MTTCPGDVPRMPPLRTACLPADSSGVERRSPSRSWRHTGATGNRRGIAGESTWKGTTITVNTPPSFLARVERELRRKRRRDCFPWALRSSIVARARSLHRRRYRSIAVLSSSFAAPHAMIRTFPRYRANGRSASLLHPLSARVGRGPRAWGALARFISPISSTSSDSCGNRISHRMKTLNESLNLKDLLIYILYSALIIQIDKRNTNIFRGKNINFLCGKTIDDTKA